MGLVGLLGDVQALLVVLQSLHQIFLAARLLLLHGHIDVDLDQLLRDIDDITFHVVVLDGLEGLFKGFDGLLGSLELVETLTHADRGEGRPVVIVGLDGNVDASLVEVRRGLEVLILLVEHLRQIVVALDRLLLVVGPVVRLGLDQPVLQTGELLLVLDLVTDLDVVLVLVLEVLVVLASGVDQNWHLVVHDVEEVDVGVDVPIG